MSQPRRTGDATMANQIGKRYVCEHCSTQLLVVKPGGGQLECHGEPMTIEVPKPLPASD
jgi:desulfoferrodoxin-like iron-binding protein